jgi:hypothetical protein
MKSSGQAVLLSQPHGKFNTVFRPFATCSRKSKVQLPYQLDYVLSEGFVYWRLRSRLETQINVTHPAHCLSLLGLRMCIIPLRNLQQISIPESILRIPRIKLENPFQSIELLNGDRKCLV